MFPFGAEDTAAQLLQTKAGGSPWVVPAQNKGGMAEAVYRCLHALCVDNLAVAAAAAGGSGGGGVINSNTTITAGARQLDVPAPAAVGGSSGSVGASVGVGAGSSSALAAAGVSGGGSGVVQPGAMGSSCCVWQSLLQAGAPVDDVSIISAMSLNSACCEHVVGTHPRTGTQIIRHSVPSHRQRVAERRGHQPVY